MQKTGLSNATSSELARLRAEMDRLQGRRLTLPPLPTHPAIEAILPGGGLRPGGTYAVQDSTSLLLALLAPLSREGSWSAMVGVPELGVEAAEDAGVDLSRLVLVPEPGARWLAVTAALTDVLPAVVVRPPGPVSAGESARLSARLREKNSLLIVDGSWPHADAVLTITDARWRGTGHGDGRLQHREVVVRVSGRGLPAARGTRILLPDAHGRMSGPSDPTVSSSVRPLLEAVG